MKIMKQNIDGVDYQFHKNENNELLVTVEGIDWGKVTSLPEITNKELIDVLETYIDMRNCLYNAEVSYSDLTKLYERYSNYETVSINNTLIVLYGNEIVAVVVGVTDLDLSSKLVFYYFARNGFIPYHIDYEELLSYANDVF
jgi:hypothetical protein